MSGNIPEAYSRLRTVLAQKNMTVFQLHRRLREEKAPVNIKSLYRLASSEPLQKVDLRIAGAVCVACNLELGELISFEKPRAQLQRLDPETQERLDDLMAKNNEGKLTASEKKDFSRLAAEAHRLSLENARILQSERRRGDRAPSRTTKPRATVTA